jgi:uncharacterized membrane protein
MKSVFSFIRSTLIGGIFFLLPVYLIFTLLYKLHLAAAKILAPLTHFLPENILGINAGKLVAILILVLICFFAGMLFRVSLVKRGIHYLEDRFLSHLPGYSLLKSKTSDTLGEKIDYYLSTVLVEEQHTWKLGLLIEEKEDLCTVYFPKAPRNDSGEVVTVSSFSVKKLNLPTKEALLHLKNFGRGNIQLITESFQH